MKNIEVEQKKLKRKKAENTLNKKSKLKLKINMFIKRYKILIYILIIKIVFLHIYFTSVFIPQISKLPKNGT